jgi:hypothetical protein
MTWIFALAAFFIGTILTSDASAAATTCSTGNNRLNQTEIANKITGKLVCAQKIGALSGNDRWAEEHQASKNLVEQGKGTTSKVHPPHKVGTWGIVGGGSTTLIEYKYDGGKTFQWSLFESKSTPGNFTFCSADENTIIATATAIAPNPSSTNACGF